MNRLLSLLTLAACFVAAAPVVAEEPPHLEFVRGLREKKYADLALEYLLKQMPLAPADQAPGFQLEIAKTRLDIASGEANISKRLALYLEARKDFEAFLAQHKTNPLIPEAKLEIAHIAVLQGKTQLSLSKRQEGPARSSEAAKARLLLEDAGRQLAVSVKQLKEELDTKYREDPKTPEETAAKKTLQQAALQAQFELALNYLDQAQTYVDETKLEVMAERGKIVEKAIPILEKVISDAANKNPIKYVAQAWLGKAEQEGGRSGKDIRNRWKGILEEKGPETDAGKRLARYYLMVLIHRSPEPNEKTPLAEARKLGEEWLRFYPAYVNTPEGFGVRFELAEVYLEEATAAAPKGQTAQTTWFNLALPLYKQLEQTDSEFADKSRQRKVTIVFNRQPAKAEIKNLPTFDDCFVRAQFEFVQMDEEVKKNDPKVDEKRKDHFKNVVSALSRALALSQAKGAPKVAESDLAEAKSLLAYTYLNTGNYEECKRLGEELAMVRPPTNHSSRAAIYAMTAYTHLEDKRDGAPKPDEKNDGLRKLAEYAELTWPDDAAGNAARHHLGLILIREKDFPRAVEKLSLIKPDYGAYTFSQYQLGMAALEAHEAKKQPVGADKRTFLEQAYAAFESIPRLPGGADPASTQTYLWAKLKLGQLMYGAKKYDQMEALVKPLIEGWPAMKARLEDEAAGTLYAGLVSLNLLANYGKAESEYKAGQYAKVTAAMGPVVAQIGKGELPEIKKSPQVYMAVLGLALRANVQQGKIDEAQKILKLLLDSSKEGDLGDPTQLLLSLVQTLKEQIQELRKKGPSAKEQLDKTISSFESFVDALAKQDTLGSDSVLFLAQSYSSLSKHDKSAELLKKVPEPKPEGGNAPDQKKMQNYRGIQMLLIRELRLAKKFDECESKLKEISGSWGKGSLQVQKEKNLLLEDQELYIPAAKAWDQMMKALQSKINADPGSRELYWESYYHLVHDVYKNGMKQSDPKKKEKGIADAAGYIIKLEAGTKGDMGSEANKKRFEELLESEAPLREKHQELKKNGK